MSSLVIQKCDVCGKTTDKEQNTLKITTKEGDGLKMIIAPIRYSAYAAVGAIIGDLCVDCAVNVAKDFVSKHEEMG